MVSSASSPKFKLWVISLLIELVEEETMLCVDGEWSAFGEVIFSLGLTVWSLEVVDESMDSWLDTSENGAI